jgi:murein DD-endopeptidase MepM/ murein hydrolase activator NlpD
MQFNRNVNPLIGLKRQAQCVLKPHRSLKETLIYWFKNTDQNYPHPFKIKGHQFHIEYGFDIKPQIKTTRHGTSSKILIGITSFLTTLSLFGWLIGSSSASIESLPKKSDLFKISTSTVAKLDTVTSNPSPTNLALVAPPMFKTSVEEEKEESVSSTVVDEIKLPNLSLKKRFLPWLHLRIQSGDNLSLIFQKHQLQKNQLHQILQLTEYVDYLRQLHIGQELHIKHDFSGHIEDIILNLNDVEELHIYREEDRFDGEIRRIGVYTEIVAIRGIVESSLPIVVAQVGLSARKQKKLKEIFQGDIDFTQIQAGDQFSVIYKQHQFEGDIEEGQILAAEFVHLDKVYRAVRYIDRHGYTDYYTPMGDSLQKVSLLRVPLEDFKRISSPFGTRRHPILGRYKFHTGVDYAAKWGTPVFAAGDATVQFVGRKGGYGKTIALEHNQRVVTLYAHLSKYAEELKVGDEVIQGELIAYVGSSGRATGPHLHFEIQLDNIHEDPQKVELPLSMPIAEDEQLSFINQTQKLISKLDTLRQYAKSTRLVHKMENSFTKLAPQIPIKSILSQHSMNSISP